MGEAGEAGKEQRPEAAHRGQDAEADGRPEACRPCRDAAAPGLDEVIDGVIDRLADQRRAETDGDAEHGAVGQADGYDAGQRAGKHRQQSEGQQAQRAIDEKEDGDDGQRADGRQAGDFALDRGPRLDGEKAGAGQLQACIGDSGGRGECCELLADGGDGGFLAVGVGALRLRLQQQQGALAVGRGPDAGAGIRLGAGVQLAQQLEQFAARVARQHRLQHHAGRRGEAIDAVGNRRPQAVDREPLGRDGRAEQVTVAEQEIAVGIKAAGFAVLHRGEFRHFCELTAQFARERGTLRGIAAFDCHHQQTSDGALLQLVDQHLLLGRRPRRQEERHVGGEAAVPDDRGAGQHGEQPEQEGAAAVTGHRLSSASISISERSPSACRYSMLRI